MYKIKIIIYYVLIYFKTENAIANRIADVLNNKLSI